MSNTLVLKQLAQVQAQAEQVSKMLLQAPSDELTQTCIDLPAAVLDFSRLMKQVAADFKADHQVQLRLRLVAAQLASCREGSIRQSVLATHALSALIPATTQNATYVPQAGARSRHPYCSAGRQSGEFRVVSA